MRLPPRPAWQRHAACHPTDLDDARRLSALFVEGSTAKAKRLCQQCPVVVECLQQALDEPGLRGVWGGMTDIERARERRRRGDR